MVMFYESHSWSSDWDSCEVYARLAEGRRPSAGETLLADTVAGSVPLRVESCRRLDQEGDGLLVLTVLSDQGAVVDRLTNGVRIRRTQD